VKARSAAASALGAFRKAVLRAAGMRPSSSSLLGTALFGMVFTAIGLGAFAAWADIASRGIEDQAAKLVAKRLANDARIYEAQLGALRRSDEQIIPRGAAPSKAFRPEPASMRGIGPEDLALKEDHPLARVKAQELRLGRDVSAFRLVAVPGGDAGKDKKGKSR
jgi:hypothetical protein